MIRKGKFYIVLVVLTFTIISQVGAQITTAPSGDKPLGDPGTNTPTTPSNAPTTPSNAPTTPSNAPTTLSNAPTTTTTSAPWPDIENNCWKCLLDILQDVCSVFTGYDFLSYYDDYPSIDIFSLIKPPFKQPSKKPSPKTRPGRSAPAQPLETSSEDDRAALLDFLHNFYLQSRENFVRDNPSTPLSDDLTTLYTRPEELVLVAADVLKVFRNNLVGAFENLSTKQIGIRLWEALDGRQRMLEDAEKALGGLTPTSISYFFRELFASLNGVSVGLVDLVSILLQNQTSMPQIPGPSSESVEAPQGPVLVYSY